MEDERRETNTLCMGWDRNTDGERTCPPPALPLSSSPQDLSRHTLLSFSDMAEGDALLRESPLSRHTHPSNFDSSLLPTPPLAGTERQCLPVIRSGIGVQLCVSDSMWMEVFCVSRSLWKGVSFLEQN